MSRPLQATLAACVVALVALLAMRGGASPGPAPRPDAVSGASATPAPAQADPGAIAAAALEARREAAMASAVATLHRYFVALGGGDHAASDAFWAGGRAPEASGEADLRQLAALRALRSQNGTPVPLDASRMPDALEIPVDLRVSVQGQPLRRYAGSYRLRRRVADGGWEITSAAVTVRTP